MAGNVDNATNPSLPCCPAVLTIAKASAPPTILHTVMAAMDGMPAMKNANTQEATEEAPLLPPRLTLVLPAHHELNNAMSAQRSLEEVDISESNNTNSNNTCVAF